MLQNTYIDERKITVFLMVAAGLALIWFTQNTGLTAFIHKPFFSTAFATIGTIMAVLLWFFAWRIHKNYQ